MKRVVKYGAPWCGPCVMMEDILKPLSKEFPDIEFESVDISLPENECILSDLKIVAIPTIVLYKNEEIVSKTTGALSLPALRTLIVDLLEGKHE
jgi:thioredoxin 1|nr:MAG TPA: TRX family protein [Crassvirales sp.]